MSATSRTTAAFGEQDAAQVREQIREQVRRDVERALAEARRARAENQIQGRLERGELQVPPPPPPPDPGVNVDIPGVTVVPGPPPQVFTGTGQPVPFGGDIPPRVQEVAFGFFLTVAVIFIGTPLSRAIARRMDRKAVAPAGPSPEVVTRLDRIEQAVEAVAIEVERISEGQRYVTKVMSEPRALPSPNEAAAHELRIAERGAAERAAAERGR